MSIASIGGVLRGTLPIEVKGKKVKGSRGGSRSVEGLSTGRR
jgi:hypothetical protein